VSHPLRTYQFSRPAALKAIAILVSVAAFGSLAGKAIARSASSGANGHVAASGRRAHRRWTVGTCREDKRKPKNKNKHRHKQRIKNKQIHRRGVAVSHSTQKSEKARHDRRSHCLSSPKPKPKKPMLVPTRTTTPISTVHATEPAPILPVSNGCDLFAALSGSDENAGSQAEPFRSLTKLVTSLKAGQTGCLQSGQTFDNEGNLYLGPGGTHGEEGQPVTVTSTDPDEPATITHSLSLAYGVNYMTFTHIDFIWSMPKPWVCWNAEGDAVPGEVISGPGKCTAGTPSPEDEVQITLRGKGDSLNYDEITNDNTNICLITSSGAEGAVIEHDRIHNCGPTVESAQSGFPSPNEEWGWHSHGLYDYGHGTIIENDYIYDNSRDGVLLNGGGDGAVVEHNIIDHNGAGVWFGDDSNDLATWNIITNSTSPRRADDYGIGSYEPGSGNVASDNCLDGNLSGEIEHGDFTSTDNKTDTNPFYTNAAQHEYTLQADSPCLGYGPDTAQP
jgi:Ni/Co efflux regulator RcnB